MNSSDRGDEPVTPRRPTFTEQYRRWRRRRIAAFSLIALGSAVVLSHVVVHLGNIQWLPMQDLLTGYPTGGALVVIGLIVLGTK
ncbi:hypothetical protein [Pseudonocardia sp.]|uniref:hypothetical protein n=1 Tax=Pseudonocardia sp. TaxID=60912 RepID=UPI0025DA822C|nr:hypothetical protein [Pseudonocardia sp.]